MQRTWESFRDTDIRPQLSDIADTKWSDTELRVYLNEALAHFSGFFPLVKSVEMTGLSTDVQWDLPSDTVEVLAVEVDGKTMSDLALKPGVVLNTLGTSASALPKGYYELANDNGEPAIRFTRAPGVSWQLHYTASRPRVETDSGVSIYLPGWAWEPIGLYIQAKAYVKIMFSDAELRRWNTTRNSGEPRDISTTPVIKMLMDRYYAILYEHGGDALNTYRSAHR